MGSTRRKPIMNTSSINSRNSVSKLLIPALVTTHPRIVRTARWLNYLLLELTGYFTKLRCCLSHDNYLLRARSATYARSSPGTHVAAAFALVQMKVSSFVRAHIQLLCGV